MNIAIAGAGAVGCHFGSLLQQAGCQVALLARGAHLQAIQAQGLKHTSLRRETTVFIQADSDPAITGGADVVLLACKMTALEAMCRQLSGHIGEHCLLATLQNGVQAPDLVAGHFPFHGVVAGAAFIGVRIDAPGHVVHSAAGSLRFGLWREGKQSKAGSRLRELLQQLRMAGVAAGQADDARALIWNKMLWNCGFNAITALTHQYARDVAVRRDTAQIALAAMHEAKALATSLGVTLPEGAADKQLAISRGLGPVKTSMWQDLDRGCPSEIDSINGFVADRAEETGLGAPVNRLLTTLVRALERR